MKKTIGVILIILGIIILIFGGYIIVQNKGNNNIEIISEIEGEPTGYQLILTATYSGAGIDGQDLGSGTIIKKYNVSENDMFYEPSFGGIWQYNDDAPNGFLASKLIIEIKKLEDNLAKINVFVNEKVYEINLKYNEDVEVSSNVSIADGKNYHYSIKIKKI